MIQIQIFLKILKTFLDDTKFEEFVSRLFRVIQTLKNRGGRGGYAAPVIFIKRRPLSGTHFLGSHPEPIATHFQGSDSEPGTQWNP